MTNNIPNWLKETMTVYTEPEMDMTEIKIPNPADSKIEILAAYLGQNPAKHFFGKIIAILQCNSRAFRLVFHVYEPHQKPYMANRMTTIQEIVPKTYNVAGQEITWHQYDDTDFAHKAFWMYTSTESLDDDGKALRQIAKALTRYSVDNQLCKKFRKAAIA